MTVHIHRTHAKLPNDYEGGEFKSGIIYSDGPIQEGEFPETTLDCHWIEDRGQPAETGTRYYLVIGNCQWESDDLESLEAILAEWARDEGCLMGDWVHARQTELSWHAKSCTASNSRTERVKSW